MIDFPVLVAHRGYPGSHPQNTIAAFDAAVEAGALWVEVDVQVRNGVPVLAHDATFYGGEETVAEFADWLAAHPDITALVDFKDEGLVEYGVEPVVRAVMDVMRGNWHPISFDYEALCCAVKHGSRAPGWVVPRHGPRGCGLDQDTLDAAAALGVRWIITNQIFLSESLPTGPWELMVYEIENMTQAKRLMSRGVRWLETKRFESIARGLETMRLESVAGDG